MQLTRQLSEWMCRSLMVFPMGIRAEEYTTTFLSPLLRRTWLLPWKAMVLVGPFRDDIRVIHFFSKAIFVRLLFG